MGLFQMHHDPQQVGDAPPGAAEIESHCSWLALQTRPRPARNRRRAKRPQACRGLPAPAAGASAAGNACGEVLPAHRRRRRQRVAGGASWRHSSGSTRREPNAPCGAHSAGNHQNSSTSSGDIHERSFLRAYSEACCAEKRLGQRRTCTIGCRSAMYSHDLVHGRLVSSTLATSDDA